MMPRNVIQVVIIDNWYPSLDAVVAIQNMKHLPTKDLESWIGGRENSPASRTIQEDSTRRWHHWLRLFF